MKLAQPSTTSGRSNAIKRTRRSGPELRSVPAREQDRIVLSRGFSAAESPQEDAVRRRLATSLRSVPENLSPASTDRFPATSPADMSHLEPAVHVAVAAGHPITAFGMTCALQRDRLTVTSQLADVEAVPSLDPAPDVTVWLPGATDDPVARAAPLAHETRLVIVLDRSIDPVGVAGLLASGVNGLLTVADALIELPEAALAASRGGAYLSESVRRQVQQQNSAALGRQAQPDPALESITPREHEALVLVASGYTHAQVARRMCVSTATVNTHIKRLRLKLEVGNKADLTRRAVEMGLLRHDVP